MSAVAIREERSGDARAIHALTAAAFAGKPYSDGSEPGLIDALRADGDLALSLVAERGAEIVGHIAFSPVRIGDGASGWFGLGPVSVLPAAQRQGIGSALVRQGVGMMRERGANGLVLLGNPGFYARFGFCHDPELIYPGSPPAYLQRLVLAGEAPSGVVRYARGFG